MIWAILALFVVFTLTVGEFVEVLQAILWLGTLALITVLLLIYFT